MFADLCQGPLNRDLSNSISVSFMYLSTAACVFSVCYSVRPR